MIASAWITVEPLSQETCLEFIPGSHKGPEYLAIDARDKNKAFAHRSNQPFIPDIENERVKCDVIIFHPRVVHGRGRVKPGRQRNTLVLRFLGDDVRYVRRPGGASSAFYNVPRQHALVSFCGASSFQRCDERKRHEQRNPPTCG